MFEAEAFEGVGGTVVTGVTGASGALTTGAFFLGAIMRIKGQSQPWEFGVVVSLELVARFGGVRGGTGDVVIASFGFLTSPHAQPH